MLADKPKTTVTDNSSQNRFELRLNGDLVGILGYFDTDRPHGRGAPVVDLLHTVIVEDFGHRGLAAILVEGALSTARERGWRIRPICTYVRRFLADHPEYRDLVLPLEPVRRRA